MQCAALAVRIASNAKRVGEHAACEYGFISLPTQQPMPNTVRKIPIHISTFVHIPDRMRRR